MLFLFLFCTLSVLFFFLFCTLFPFSLIISSDFVGLCIYKYSPCCTCKINREKAFILPISVHGLRITLLIFVIKLKSSFGHRSESLCPPFPSWTPQLFLNCGSENLWSYFRFEHQTWRLPDSCRLEDRPWRLPLHIDCSFWSFGAATTWFPFFTNHTTLTEWDQL